MSWHNSNLIWSGLGFFASKGGLVLSIVLSSHYLIEKDYIHYSLFLIAVNVFSGIISGSLSLMANRYSHKSSAVFGVWLTIQTLAIVSALLYFIYGLLSSENNWINLAESLYILGNTYVFSSNGTFYGQTKYRLNSLAIIIIGGLMILSSVLLQFHSNYLVFIVSLTIPLVIYNIWSSLYLLKNFPRIFSLDNIQRGLLRVFLPSFISGLLFQPAILISAELLLIYSINSEVIVYSVTNQIRMVLMSFSIIIGSVLINQLVASKNRFRSNEINIKISYYPIVIIAASIILFTDYIFRVFGRMNEEIFMINLQITAAISIVASMNSAIGRNFVVDERGKMGAYNNFTWLVSYIFCSILLIPSYGSIGANISFLFASLIQFFIWMPYAIRHQYLIKSFFDNIFWLTIVLLVLIIVTKLVHLHFMYTLIIYLLLCFWIVAKLKFKSN